MGFSNPYNATCLPARGQAEGRAVRPAQGIALGSWTASGWQCGPTGQRLHAANGRPVGPERPPALHVPRALPWAGRSGVPSGRKGIRPSALRLPPSAFTLIEMLVVVTIMMILVAAAATTFRPAGESRRIREAARAINVYLGSARNRAMETGRPCGVMFRRFAGAPAAVMNLDQCEVPPCYAGDTEQSTATVVYDNDTGTLTATLCSSDSPDNLLRRLDYIQLNYQGPLYSINTSTPVDSNTQYVIRTGADWVLTCDTGGQAVPWPTAAPGVVVPYRIFRSPVKGGATPLQLPAATVVDLDASGIDPPQTGSPHPDTRFSDADGSIIILFSPNGSVDRVYAPPPTSMVGETGIYCPTSPIFLLVGRRERIPFNPDTYVITDPATWPNWCDPANLWVVINPQTGLVTSGENAATNMNTVNLGNPTTDIFNARSLARDAQSMGGK